MRIVFSAALTMSYTVRAATETAVSASISTPVRAVVLAVAVITTPRQCIVKRKLHIDLRQGQRMAQGDQVGRTLGGGDARDLGHGEHVPLLELVRPNEINR